MEVIRCSTHMKPYRWLALIAVHALLPTSLVSGCTNEADGPGRLEFSHIQDGVGGLSETNDVVGSVTDWSTTATWGANSFQFGVRTSDGVVHSFLLTVEDAAGFPIGFYIPLEPEMPVRFNVSRNASKLSFILHHQNGKLLLAASGGLAPSSLPEGVIPTFSVRRTDIEENWRGCYVSRGLRFDASSAFKTVPFGQGTLQIEGAEYRVIAIESTQHLDNCDDEVLFPEQLGRTTWLIVAAGL